MATDKNETVSMQQKIAAEQIDRTRLLFESIEMMADHNEHESQPVMERLNSKHVVLCGLGGFKI